MLQCKEFTVCLSLVQHIVLFIAYKPHATFCWFLQALYCKYRKMLCVLTTCFNSIAIIHYYLCVKDVLQQNSVLSMKHA